MLSVFSTNIPAVNSKIDLRQAIFRRSSDKTKLKYNAVLYFLSQERLMQIENSV